MGRRRVTIRKLGDDGKQPYLSARYTPAALVKKLNEGSAKQWEKMYIAEIKEACVCWSVENVSIVLAAITLQRPSRTTQEDARGSRGSSPPRSLMPHLQLMRKTTNHNGVLTFETKHWLCTAQ